MCPLSVALFERFTVCSAKMVEPDRLQSPKPTPIHAKCGSYRGFILLEHAMKVVERIIEYGIRHQIEIDDMQ